MAETRNPHLTFHEINPPATARLIRTTTPPDPATLTPGDMVICATTTDAYINDCHHRGIHVRTGDYRYEIEKVFTRRGRRSVATDYPDAFRGTSPMAPPHESFDTHTSDNSTAAFALTWDALSTDTSQAPVYTDASTIVPADWLPLLPYPTLNPAQVEAFPYVTSDQGAFIVAPTGAGKTVIGMCATADEIKNRGGKVVWLVPQRSLTAELDRDMDLWRNNGMKVVALSGETTTDLAATREAHLWVATTEKFEALCRATSMRDTIAQIGTLIVDEIHLLGEPGRGPLLEALLARFRADSATRNTRLIGLSATASNAAEVAEWLGIPLLEITWRPTRNTQQVLTLPIGDRNEERDHRNAMARIITTDVTTTGGSVLVFCGTKANVRSTALAIAESRGVRIDHINPDDVPSVAAACDEAHIGLHYSDWPYRRKAEEDFRNHDTDVLVATSTLAAGVNTPARAVIVRDTTIGPTPMEVSTIQQMCGRGGRAGKEPEGWSFLLATSDKVADLRRDLCAGYTIRSGILKGIPDYLLGELVQNRVGTVREAEQWWTGTLAHHQGESSLRPLNEALDLLTKWRFVEAEEIGDGDQRITATPLGLVTSRMMVNVLDATALISALSSQPTPSNHLSAENALCETVAKNVYAFANSPDAPFDQAEAVMRLVAAQGDVNALGPIPNRPPGGLRVPGVDVVKTGMLLCARSPYAMAGRQPRIHGVNRSVFNQALYDAPRYLAWLAALGQPGLIPGWAGVVAADLGPRITHHNLAPLRGAGRLLRVCERNGGKSPAAVRTMWERLVDGEGLRAPGPLTPGTAVHLRVTGSAVHAAGSSVVYCEGSPYWKRIKLARGVGSVPAGRLVVAYAANGDWDASGWLHHFCHL